MSELNSVCRARCTRNTGTESQNETAYDVLRQVMGSGLDCGTDDYDETTNKDADATTPTVGDETANYDTDVREQPKLT